MLMVSSDSNDQPGRFDVGPEEKQGLLGFSVGLSIGLS